MPSARSIYSSTHVGRLTITKGINSSEVACCSTLRLTSPAHLPDPGYEIWSVYPPPDTRLKHLPDFIARDLIPLDLLPRNRQLSSQALECLLTQLYKAPIQFLLVLPLERRNLLDDLRGACPTSHAYGDRLVCQQPYVAVLVVVHVDLYAARECAGGGIVDVLGAPAAVPIVVGAVFVCDGCYGDFAVGVDGVDARGGGGIVFTRVG